MKITSCTLDLRMAWWFRFYCWGLFAVVFVTGLEPDWEKVQATVRRAIRIRVR